MKCNLFCRDLIHVAYRRRRHEPLVVEVISAETDPTTAPTVSSVALTASRFVFGLGLSLPGVFVGIIPVAMGVVVGKCLTIKTGQTHVQRYLEPLLKRIVDGEIDPSFLVTHTASLQDGPELYKTFRDKKDGCIKVVMKPHG